MSYCTSNGFEQEEAVEACTGREIQELTTFGRGVQTVGCVGEINGWQDVDKCVALSNCGGE